MRFYIAIVLSLFFIFSCSSAPDEPVQVNLGIKRIEGSQSGRNLEEGSFVRSRIVSKSINHNDPRSSKIGLNCKMDGLGSFDFGGASGDGSAGGEGGASGSGADSFETEWEFEQFGREEIFVGLGVLAYRTTGERRTVR